MEEDLLLGKIEAEFYTEIGTRSKTEREYLMTKYDGMDHDELWAAYLDVWLERLGSQAAMTEFKVAHIAYAARVCEGVHIDGDAWDHSECNGHPERIWDSLAEVRALPEVLQDDLTASLDEMEMTEREAKNSDRQTSSSGSSRLPSEVEGSTPSTPTKTPVAPPGTSSPPSTTPSPSTDGLNSPTPTSRPSTSG